MRPTEGGLRLSAHGPAQLTLTCDDDFRLEATCHEATGAPRAVVVVAGALGVPRRFYARFAEFLASQGLTTLTFDYRGVAESVPEAGQEILIDMERWGRLDIDAAIRSMAALFPGVPIYLVGHSCGGQLFGLAEASTMLAGAVLVGATLPHASRYPRPERYLLSFLWRVLAPLYTLGAMRGKGHVPTALPMMSGAMAPRRVLRQWSQWCRRKEYLFDARFGLDTSRYGQLTLPVLTITVSDDEMAPQPAVMALAERFPAATVERRLVDVLHMGYGRLGHMGFFRSKTRDALWFPVVHWVLRQRDDAVAEAGEAAEAQSAAGAA